MIESFGPAFCAAAAENRPFPDGSPATASDNKIFNNIFISNHGNVELPFPHADAMNNRSDSNVFVDGGDFRFWRSRATPAEIFRNAKAKLRSKSDLADFKKATLTGAFTPAVWSKITGWEKQSVYLDFTQMTCCLKPFEASLRLRVNPVAALLKAKCRRVRGVKVDFSGRPIGGKRILPGPFQDLREGDNYYLLFARNGLISGV